MEKVCIVCLVYHYGTHQERIPIPRILNSEAVLGKRCGWSTNTSGANHGIPVEF